MKNLIITLLLTFCVGSSFSQFTDLQKKYMDSLVTAKINAAMIPILQGDSINISGGKIGLTKATIDKFNKMFSDLYTHLGMASETNRITALEAWRKAAELKQADDDKMKAKLKTIATW